MPRLLALAAALLAAQTATADVSFGNWSEQRFSMFGGNDWSQSRSGVTVASDGAVSMLWTALPDTLAEARSASWSWQVDSSVPRTALDRKGGDDRNLSLYFIFMPPDIAAENRGRPLRRLMNIEEARVLMYVWGGEHPRDSILPSPYLGDRGRTVALRPAGTGSNSEQIDLDRDYRRAFGGEATALVGLALSADSDDTDTSIRAGLSNLRLR